MAGNAGKGRPAGSKNKPKSPLVVRKALREMDHGFVESAYKFLSAPHDNMPKPTTAMEKLILNTYEMAIAGDKTSHQYAKLLLERVIPQRKQVEHLGETDAQRLGVNINVITEKATEDDHNGKEPGITIEHEPGRREQSHGNADDGGRTEGEPEPVATH